LNNEERVYFTMIWEPFETALVVVDVQQGFTTLCPAELPVLGGLEIIPAINQLLSMPFARIDATQDWHPPDHCSFLGQRDNIYPPHCVMNTPGAEFVPGLHSHRFHAIWRKGFVAHQEAYAITAQQPSFIDTLKARNINTVCVCGIATNICCFYTARDLRRAGFRVIMIEDASAGIDVPAASLYQATAKAEAITIGIEYRRVSEFA
jgi:nicotinamidase/pyrazinamidase